MNLYNKEGYLSLTEYEALSRIELSEKRRLLVYICSPYSGNVNHNIKMAQKYSRFAVYKNFIPITPHIYFTQFFIICFYNSFYQLLIFHTNSHLCIFESY
jgi:hypothetical protein